MRRILPGGTIALFARRRAYVRGDIVIVRHPEYGTIVRAIFAVSRDGRYSLEPLNRQQARGLGFMEPEWVRARMLFRLI
ncbi:MAG: S24/S26 family peptidase [Erythrobacter sp.]|uniref:S24/S26 family peptidase n=1 Tax=Erythrobacter sp. TaxID=1042 RepID=UPI0032EACC40